ncbi:hypothetical protein [Mycobacterium lehmannii]|uniref:hypothetical protein n=1 Tax=Mycobacterium lehmannii TaxID=2048550 RepID=UPI000B93FAF1|nr:hypothetical protein [Mycobacterium lehmannii]
MTGPEDDHSNTRPISVAELLARNGTIGAPPVGGRRRRRRGADSVTVAELTGEIPIIRDDDAPATGRSAAATVEAPAETEPVAPAEAADAEPATDTAEAAPAETAETAAANGAVDHTEETVEEEALEVPEDEPLEASGTETSEVEAVEDEAADAAGADEDTDYADAVSDYQTHIEQRDADEDLDFFAPPRRSTFARRRFGMLGRSAPAEPGDAQVGAEEMSPDPVDWADPDADEDEAADAAVAVAEPEHDDERDDRPSYLRSPDDALFGGPDVDDDVARPDNDLSPADVDLDEDAPRSGAMSSILRGAMVVGQCVVAVAFGAGLFIAFDQLWKWNSIVALVLGVLVILGLVVGVRVVRKTEDIGSTLIAVAVGAMVTFGPLALMQAA